ncbi:MAG: hypothetical protein MUF23_13905 [Pirellula sp.]|nr:hypothetical protein [Pirellula sp.]
MDHAFEQPRATPMTRTVMKKYLEDLKKRSPRIPLPEMTEDEKKAGLEDPRAVTYESRLRKQYLPDSPTSSYLPFSGSASNNPQSASRMGPPEPLLTLDYGFKVRLFWIAARANNCQYCLGHQESKLLGVGMTEDEIAALDCDWELFPEKEQVAFSLAKRLTLEPHLISDEDIDRCRPFYSEAQLIEMIGSIAGNNAINRWKEGAGIPQSTNGGGFGNRDRTAGSTSEIENHTYLTTTSGKYAERPSIVVDVESSEISDTSLAQVSPTLFRRAPLETREVVNKQLAAVSSRTPRFALADEATTQKVFGDLIPDGKMEQWHRLLAHFPVAGKRFATGMHSSSQADMLSPALQSQINWVVARQDRAWYAASLALEDLHASGLSDKQIDLLDQNLDKPVSGLEERDRLLLNVARKLCASPIVLTDKDVALAVEIAGPRAVTQTIHYAAYRAAFDRITEASGLSHTVR